MNVTPTPKYVGPNYRLRNWRNEHWVVLTTQWISCNIDISQYFSYYLAYILPLYQGDHDDNVGL